MAFNYYGQGATPGWWRQTTGGTPRNYTPAPIPDTRIKDAFAAQMPAWFKNWMAAKGQMGTGNLLTGGGYGGPPDIYHPPPGLGPGMAQAPGGGGGYGGQQPAWPIGAAYQTPAAMTPELWNNAFVQSQTGPYGVSTPTGYQPPAGAGVPYAPPAPAQPQYKHIREGYEQYQPWYVEFQKQHQGQTPEEYYAMTSAQAGNPTEGLGDALSDLEWSQAFARDHGRPPNEDEWRWWWFTTREGGTPEAKAAAQNQGGGGGGGGGGEQKVNPPLWVPPQTWWR